MLLQVKMLLHFKSDKNNLIIHQKGQVSLKLKSKIKIKNERI